MSHTPRILIAYTSQDGQTRKIMHKMAEHLTAAGQPPQLCDLATQPPTAEDLTQADVIVLAAAIRYGKPLKAADSFARWHNALLKEKPLALLMVNLSARKEGKTTLEGSPYLRKFIARHSLAPQLTAAIAGKIDYPKYRWFDRLIIRFIMHLTKGPTDPTACIEYTDWQQVASLAKEIHTLSFPLDFHKEAV